MENSKEIEKTLKTIKNNIEKAKEELSESKGQKKALLARLKKDYGLNNLMEAGEAVEKLKKEIEILGGDVDSKYIKLKEKYNFI